jgi:hypothetical protein
LEIGDDSFSVALLYFVIYNICLRRATHFWFFAEIRISKRCGLLTVCQAGRSQSCAEARAELVAGSNVVQTYTGLIQRGPALLWEAAPALKSGT